MWQPMIDYSWVPWFRELAGKIANGGANYLAQKAKAVDWRKCNPAILRYGDENIDPFSFFYTLASHRIDQEFMRRLGSAHRVFDLKTALPAHRPHIIQGLSARAALFHKDGRGNSTLLWRLFSSSVLDAPGAIGTLFDEAKAVPNVGLPKLTRALFIVNPELFYPADRSSKRALGKASSVVLPQSEFDGEASGYSEYDSRVKALKAYFPGCAPYEIAAFLDIQEGKEPLITGETSYFQMNTGVVGLGRENAVWAGHDECDQPAPLAEPKAGDVILLRHGVTNGRGIGVVEANGYVGGPTARRISVYWINKRSVPLEGQTDRRGFGLAGKASRSYQAFEQASGYAATLELVDRLAAYHR